VLSFLRFLVPLAALAVVPQTASAGTTVSNAGGVEVIVSQPDLAVVRARPHHAPRSAARTAPVGRATPSLAGAQTLVGEALALVGTPYVWGGTSPQGFDCSGFTYYAFARLGIRIPRTADAQFATGHPVSGNPLPGDLVFFQTYDYGASHVGIYLGGGRFVNSIGSDVHVTTFASEYFRERYLGARRFLSV
jgi:cell wall-associated NlpC family hydrolase